MGGCFSKKDRENNPIPRPSPNVSFQNLPPNSPPRNSVDVVPNNKNGNEVVETAAKNETEALPYVHVDSSLRGLVAQAEGFGRLARGGDSGAVYCVTSLADDGRGSLREGCRRKEPLWIVFEVSGTICLSAYLRVSSHKTIDGRGQKVKLTGKGIQLRNCEHVIICNLEFEGGRGQDADGIQIKPNSKHLWIDRCSLHDYDNESIVITHASTNITISRCYFTMHDKTLLIGAGLSHIADRCIRVTIHHCFFDGTRQWHPRVRFGKVHLYNNYTRNWGTYAVCAGVESQIFSQANIYEAGHKKLVFEYYNEKAADRNEPTTGSIRSEGDLYLNGAKPHLLPGSSDCVFNPHDHYSLCTKQTATESLKGILQMHTGWQAVPRPLDIMEASATT